MVAPDDEPAAAPYVRRREMGLTHAEFIRSLPPALTPATFTVDGRRITVHGAEGAAEITLSEQRERRIALLRLPVLDVELTLTGFTAPAREAFLRQFDRAFQRGGG